MFFFLKKNQKTFAPLRAVVKRPLAKIIKVFLLLFVHKKKFFLPFFTCMPLNRGKVAAIDVEDLAGHIAGGRRA